MHDTVPFLGDINAHSEAEPAYKLADMASLLSEPLKAAGQDWNYSSSLPTVLTTVIGILLSTRFLTGLQSGYVKSATDSGSAAPWLPYWIPLIGHLFSFLWDPISFLRGAK
jgi:hypothetical protein